MIKHLRAYRYRNVKTKQQKMLVKLNRLVENWEEARNTDSALFFKRPAKVIWASIVIGISRGVGFVIGVSIVSSIVIAVLGWVLAKFVSLPIIGEYIALIVEHVQQYLNNGNNF